MRTRAWVVWAACSLAVLIGAVGSAGAGAAKAAYPAMAPVAQYMITSSADEIALARSAAPASISDDAEVMTLGRQGYETAAKGKNGFVCMVWRSWTAGYDDPNFWNPRLRSPVCLNAAAARTVLPELIERTKWALTGISRTDMIERSRAAMAANKFTLPAPGAMSYMMSKQGYLGDGVGHWHPHVMFHVARTDSAAWGANLGGSPVMAAQDDQDPTTTFFVLVPKWSDGTSAVVGKH